MPLVANTSEYGKAFEHFIILEIYKMCEYLKNDYRLSYLRTKDDAEIDLIVERPGEPDLLIEIKSTQNIQDHDVRALSKFVKTWDQSAEAILLSKDDMSKIINSVRCYPWQEGLKKFFS
ncbi:MAG: hypothetical protein A2Z20_10730 [Bdellovibrionales bacterium RBG_16_40_8]|nr:MAG: hypothetical protein A2Z20_10730 [Bdellovibrionales bacterium RBG_16_40_8]